MLYSSGCTPQATSAQPTTFDHACSKKANARKLQSLRGKDAYKANDLLADQLVTVDQRLDYEAIIHIAEIDDQDVLYLNFDNVALGGCQTDPVSGGSSFQDLCSSKAAVTSEMCGQGSRLQTLPEGGAARSCLCVMKQMDAECLHHESGTGAPGQPWQNVTTGLDAELLAHAFYIHTCSCYPGTLAVPEPGLHHSRGLFVGGDVCKCPTIHCCLSSNVHDMTKQPTFAGNCRPAASMQSLKSNSWLGLQAKHISFCAGALPYIIALDRDTKSVVISIRGTVTLADLATDMMAEPKAMDEWLPDSMAHVRIELAAYWAQQPTAENCVSVHCMKERFVQLRTAHIRRLEVPALSVRSQTSAMQQVRAWQQPLDVESAGAEPATATTCCELALLRYRTRLVHLARVRSWRTRASWLLPLPSGRICGSTVSCRRSSTSPNCLSLWPRRPSLTLAPATLKRCVLLLNILLCIRGIFMCCVGVNEVLQSKALKKGLKSM